MNLQMFGYLNSPLGNEVKRLPRVFRSYCITIFTLLNVCKVLHHYIEGFFFSLDILLIITVHLEG